MTPVPTSLAQGEQQLCQEVTLNPDFTQRFCEMRCEKDWEIWEADCIYNACAEPVAPEKRDEKRNEVVRCTTGKVEPTECRDGCRDNAVKCGDGCRTKSLGNDECASCYMDCDSLNKPCFDMCKMLLQ
jgi:hypothetical protein